jgi:2-polyprenyl-3-methyl-5-hydroxy-6-metoxy-1,4-benzoquinol methylase
MKHNQEFLNFYFSEIWSPGNSNGITSHQEIAKKIKNEWVLDVGCGTNPFKSLIKNVIGIDPAFDQADYKCTIEDYYPDRLFDVATCLGSINFGDEITIEKQIDKVVNCLKPNSRIYWRLNPGRQDHGNQECFNIPFFPWTFEKLDQFAKKYNYLQTVEMIDHHPSRSRLYAEWHRSL